MVEELCALCEQPANQRCAGCRLTYYCSRDHQRLHWKNHREQCKSFKVAENPILGRHLVATRDLKPGEVILREVPLIAGPAQVTAPVCLGCYCSLSEDMVKPCPECGWPVCSEKCANSAAHRPECHITTSRRQDKVTVRNFNTTHPLYQSVTVLRCLYQKEANPAVWDKLQALESHCTARKKTPRYEEERTTVAKCIRRFFKLEDFSEEEILRMCGMLQVNGHEVPVTEPGHVAVYDYASLLEHSCRPTCSKSFTAEGVLVVRVAEALSKGQHISICYTDALWGTANRRHHLQETKFFACQCSRCADRTEYGTNFSAVRCFNSTCEGYLLPVEPLKEDSDWICGRCDQKVEPFQVLEVLRHVGEELSSLQKGNPEACERFISSYSVKAFHPNHYYLTDVRLALAQLYGQNNEYGLPGIPNQELQAKITLCRQVLELINKLVPAEHRVRGLLLFELHAAIAEAARRASSVGQMDPATLREHLLESKRLLVEASFLLSQEPEILPEGKIAAQAEANLAKLNALLQNLHTSIGDSPL